MRKRKRFLKLTAAAMILFTFLCSSQQAFAMEILDKFSPNEMTDSAFDSFGEEVSNDVKADIEQSKLPVFFMIADYNGEQYLFHSFYVKDTYKTGGSYFISSVAAYIYAQSGADLYVVIDGAACKVECLGTKGSLSYLKCSEISNYTAIDLKEEITDLSLLAVYVRINADEKVVLDTSNLDISSWKENSGYYASGEQLSNLSILGIPLFDKNSYKLVGMLEMNTETSEVVMINLTQMEFEESYALAAGTPKESTKSEPESSTVTQESEAESEEPVATEPATVTQEPEAEPVIAEPEKTEDEPAEESSTSSTPEWIYVAVVLVIATAVYLSKNKKKKRKQPAEASNNKEDYPKNGTIPLMENGTVKQENAMKTAQNVPIEPSWQVRGMSGTFMGQTFALTGVLRFGRNSQHQVVFPQNTKGISGDHCELSMENGRIILRDLGSTYGTYLKSGEKLNERVSYELKEGDIFYLAEASQSFRVERIGESRQEFTPAVKAAMYPKTGETYRANANGRIQFGRSANCEVSFGANDTKISTSHCVLYREKEALYLMDLGSTNGTFFSENKRLQPNVPYRVEKGMAFYLTSQNYLFVITED